MIPSTNLNNKAYQSTITIMIMRTIMEHIIQTKLNISFSRVDRPTLGSFVSFAILPKTVLFPVDTTIPVQVPETQ